MADDELARKFLTNVAPILGQAGAEMVLETCTGLEDLESAAGLVRLLAPSQS